MTSTEKSARLTTWKSYLRRSWQLYIMLIPALVFLVVFCFLPMIGISIAFQDFIPTKGFFGSKWVGLEHFRYLFTLPDVGRVIVNTVIIAGLKILIGFPVPIIVALMLNEVRLKMFKRSVQTIIYLPNFLSWVIIAGMITSVFSLDGLVNTALQAIGLNKVFFLGSNNTFIPLLIGTDVWKGFGFSTVIYMSSLAAIDGTLYEAAVMDGATRFKQTIHITLPGLKAIILLMAILSIGNILNAGFDQIFNLYNPLVEKSSEIIDTYVYKLAFQNFNFSLSTAVGLFKSVVSAIFIAGGYLIAYKVADYRVF